MSIPDRTSEQTSTEEMPREREASSSSTGINGQGCIQDFFLEGGGEGRSHGRLMYVYAPLPCVYTSK